MRYLFNRGRYDLSYTNEPLNPPLPLFNVNIDTYNGTGNYIGNNFIFSNYKGAWLKIKLPEPIVLRKFAFSSYMKLNEAYFESINYEYLPGSWKCYGSIDDITYIEIPEANSPYRISTAYYVTNLITYTQYLANTFNTPYIFFVWVFNQLTGISFGTGTTQTITGLFEIEIYGDDNTNIISIVNISNNNGLSIPSMASAFGSNGDRIILRSGNKDTIYPYSIGLNSNTMWFSVPTNGTYLWYSNLTSNMFLNNIGTLNIFNDVSCFNNASDSNLKINIKPFDFDCIDLINKIKPVEFTWKDIKQVPENKKNTTDFGFIAQEIEELLPNIVKETTEYKIIKYEKIIPYLVKAIQELDIKLKKIEEE
jgi:hypothetical protein